MQLVLLPGPIDIEQSKTYGCFGHSKQVGLGITFGTRRNGDIPYWTTDVNGAGWAEFETGAAKSVDNMVYLTVGTGVELVLYLVAI